MGRLVGVLGLATMVGLAYVFSTDRKAIRLKTVLWGFGLQFAFALFVLRFTAGRKIFEFAGYYVNLLLSYAFVGSQFVFGELGMKDSPEHFIFAFQVLPTIIFIAAFFALLYHIGVMQVLIRGAAWLMTRIMGASGAESLNVAASIFMGQTEAPLTIRPFLNRLTKSELMCVMTSGMAHVSGGIMAAYIAFGIKPQHLLEAVIMTAPGTLLMSKMLVPETEVPLTAGRVEMPEMEKEANFLGAISRGTVDGLHLALNVGAMLISFLAMLALVNAIMGGTHNWLAAPPRGLVSVQPAASFWMGFRSGGVGDRGSLARLRDYGQFIGHAHGGERGGGVPAAWRHASDASIRGPLQLRPLRCADLRISVPWEFRLAGLERWLRSNAAILRSWVSGRCWRGPWRI